jgi:glycosyltransferase 2 family protein
VKRQVKKGIKFLLFIGIGIVLFLLVYKDMDIESVIYEIKQVNYWWFVIFTLLSALSNISRTVRWQMLIKSYGGKAGFFNTFFATLIGYFANMALPRLGEVTRCGIISKYEKQPFSKVLGTMVSERFVDLIMLILVMLSAFILQKDIIMNFIKSNPEIEQNAERLFSWTSLIVLVGMGITAIVFIYYIVKGSFDKYIIFRKTGEFFKSFWIGLISIRNVKNKTSFILHSIFIWTMYFLMIYVAFPAFDGFDNLDIYAALTLFVAASFGMLAPAPNGVGAYHFMLSQTLILYGIAVEKALVFALVVHGIQTLLIVFAGIVSLILLPLVNKQKNNETQ